MITHTATHKPQSRISQYWALTKPRVTQLAVFCAVIGMFLATDGFPGWHVLVWATLGIWLLAGAAFAVNCLIAAEVDARMARTARRATAMGALSTTQTLVFSAILGGLGMGILYTMVNPLTMWLTFVTFVGYALVYTILLKPNTPQNIVIGGLSGAMPPALRWQCTAATTTCVPACRCCRSPTACSTPACRSGCTRSRWRPARCCRSRWA
jgi:protoheme IX farnesyltransferase